MMVMPLSPIWIAGAIVVFFVGSLLFDRAMRRQRRAEVLPCPVHGRSYETETVWANSLGQPNTRVDITACDHFDDRHVTCEKRCLEGPSIFSLRQVQAGARSVREGE